MKITKNHAVYSVTHLPTPPEVGGGTGTDYFTKCRLDGSSNKLYEVFCLIRAFCQSRKIEIGSIWPRLTSLSFEESDRKTDNDPGIEERIIETCIRAEIGKFQLWLSVHTYLFIGESSGVSAILWSPGKDDDSVLGSFSIWEHMLVPGGSYGFGSVAFGEPSRRKDVPYSEEDGGRYCQLPPSEVPSEIKYAGYINFERVLRRITRSLSPRIRADQWRCVLDKYSFWYNPLQLDRVYWK